MSEHYLDFNSIIQYISDNLLGLFLLVLSFCIIYFVDCINNFNALLYQIPSPIPGLPPPVNSISKKKIKKR